jgi:anti-anti-sigma factor
MLSTTELLTIERVGDMVILIPTSDLSEMVYERLESEAGHVLSVFNDPSVQNVVVDFSCTDYFGSTALAFLVRLWKRVTERRGRMVLCNLSEHEREVLHITQLGRLWPVATSRAEAMRLVGT